MPTLFRRPGFWVLVVLASVVAAAGIGLMRPPMVEVVTVVEKALEQHLVASGRVWVPTRVQIASQVPGLIVAVGAVEGQRVKVGELLVQIEDTEARAAVNQAKANLVQTKARVEKLKRVGSIADSQSLREAETNLEAAEENLKRISTLSRAGAVTQMELDDARRSLERAKAHRAVAEAQQLSSSPLGPDSRLALAAQMQAEAELVGAEARLAKSRLVAPQNGLVLTRSVEPGDVVQAGNVLMTFAADAEPELVIEPDERNLAEIKLGQLARAAADAFPQKPFDAKVSYVAPAINPQRGSVEVRLTVTEPPPFLRPDMTVSVDLTLAKRDQAKVLPKQAVHGLGGPTPWVYVVTQGRLTRIPVQLGLRGDEFVEIIAGPTEGDQVVSGQVAGLVEGKRVRAAQKPEG